MGLIEDLRDLKTILEKEYGLLDVQFREDFEYAGERGIPGFSFSLRDPSQISLMEETVTKIQKEIMADYKPEDVVCYLRKSSKKPEVYREIHVRIKHGEKYEVLGGLIEKLTKNLKQRLEKK